ncbi:Gfo/Idh/MocA family protein [Saccharopolyspora sp. CA-218241]|uniref:Gfo/Idh/MocA family protein n=1 Tax=Saccharopolyspora sp. CA-218241 TaxID=3240027 RepID=UPI003D9858BA
MTEDDRGRGAVSMAVLGCADIAWRRTLPALRGQPRLRLAALASRDLRRAREFAARFGGVPVTDYQHVLDRDDIDAVYLPLPPALHEEWACRALRAGKHVLVEKPMATSAGAAERMLALAREQDRWLVENMMIAHHGQHAAVRGLIAAGRIGQPRGLTGVFGIPPRPPTDFRYDPALGGGALLDLGVYPLRAAALLLPGEWEPAGAALRVDQRTGVDLSGHALLRGALGSVAHVSFGFEFAYRCAYSIWGAEGRLVLDRAFTPPPTRRPVIRIERGGHVEELPLHAEDQFAASLRAFADAVLDGRPPAHDATDVLAQARLVDKVRARAVEIPV